MGTCRLACSFYDKCKYYIWNKDNTECAFSTSGVRDCDNLIGLPTPDYDSSCGVTPATTTKKATTTPKPTTTTTKKATTTPKPTTTTKKATTTPKPTTTTTTKKAATTP